MADKDSDAKNIKRKINCLAGRFVSILIIRRLTSLLAGWLFLWGAGIIILRAIGAFTPYDCLRGIWGVPFLFPIAYLLERSRFPSLVSLRAILDLRNNCGGLLMAEADTDIRPWELDLPKINIPCVKWHSRRSYAYLAVSISFAAVAMLAPIRHTITENPHRLEIGNRVKELESKIEVLKEETIIEENKAQELLENLEELDKEASGDDPVKTWEALDHIELAISETAKKEGEEALAKAEELGKAEALSDALGRLQKEDLNPAMVTETMKELGRLIDSMSGDELPPDLLESCRKGVFSQEQLKELARCLGKSKSDILDKIGRLCKEKLLDAKILEECRNYSQCDSGALAELLAEEGKKVSQCMKVSDMLACSMPGRGGISRGRGDAPMTWKEETNEENAEFREEVLQQTSVSSLRDSKLVGVSIASPSVNQETESKAGMLSAAGEGGAAYSQVVLPRHRSAVKKYFEREE